MFCPDGGCSRAPAQLSQTSGGASNWDFPYQGPPGTLDSIHLPSSPPSSQFAFTPLCSYLSEECCTHGGVPGRNLAGILDSTFSLIPRVQPSPTTTCFTSYLANTSTFLPPHGHWSSISSQSSHLDGCISAGPPPEGLTSLLLPRTPLEALIALRMYLDTASHLSCFILLHSLPCS